MSFLLHACWCIGGIYFTLQAPPRDSAAGVRDFPYLVAFAPSGNLLATTWGKSRDDICLWDIATGKQVRTFSPKVNRPASMTFSPDGSMLASSSDTKTQLWRLSDGALLRKLHGPSPAFAPHGKWLLTGDNGGPGGSGGFFYLNLWDARNGNNLRRIVMPNAICDLAYAPDQHAAAVYVMPDAIRIWDLGTGKELQKLQGIKNFIRCLAYSPDGRALAGANGSANVTWDIKTGKIVRSWDYSHIQDGAVWATGFSPDGKWLAWGGRIEHIYLCRTKGKRSPWAAIKENAVFYLAFSADSKLLALGTWNSVRIVEVATGQEVAVMNGRAPRQYPSELSTEQLQVLWNDLASDDAAKAYRALWGLTAAPAQSVPFLQRRLRPARVDQKRLTRLIEELASGEFKVRKAATDELEKLEEIADPFLEKRLASGPGLELARRIEQIRETNAGPTRDRDQLRELRAMKALEHIGSADARNVITILAKGGDAEAPLTQEARASLARLAKQSSAE